MRFSGGVEVEMVEAEAEVVVEEEEGERESRYEMCAETSWFVSAADWVSRIFFFWLYPVSLKKSPGAGEEGKEGIDEPS